MTPEIKENIPDIQKQNFEVHTMPQKFLSTRPVFKQTKNKKSHKPMGFKTNLIIGLVVIGVFAGLLILAAWLFLRSFNEPDKQPIYQEQNIPSENMDNSVDSPMATTTLDNLDEQQRLKELLDINKWQTIENNLYHYSFKFPSSWQQETPVSDDIADTIIIKNEEGINFFELLVFANPEKITLRDWLISEEILQEDLESFTLAGQAGYKINQLDNRYAIFIAYHNNFYKLSFIKTEDNIFNQLNNKILINFKFLEVPEENIDSAAPVYNPATDSDHDGLTDVEEALYGSDKLKRDSDGDSYIDGEEVSNLFHPAVAGSVRIYEREVVSTYINAIYNYNLIYPAVWEIKDKDDSVIFQDASGEFIQVLVSTNDENYNNIINWYKANINLDITDLTQLTVSGVPAIRTTNGYFVYFLLGDNIYTLLYNINLRQDANFMTTFDMVIKSFKLMTSN